MAFDSYFEFHATGNTATSLNGTSGLFLGDYNGLSSLNEDEVVYIQCIASAGDIRLFGAGTDDPQYSEAASDAGLVISVATSIVELPAMRVGNASKLGYTQITSGNDASAIWVIWKQVR